MDITALKRTVNGLFTVTYQYQVPVFQRPFSWGAKQLDDLWTDVFDEGVDSHFLGPVVLFKTNREDDDSNREVIDGQQRLVTLQVLLAIIRDRWTAMGQTRKAETPNGLITRRGFFENDEDAYVFKSADRNWAFLRDFILRAPDDEKRRQDTRSEMGTLSADELAANKALRDAWRNLRKRVDKYVDAGPEDPDQRLGKLEKKLSARVELVTIEVTDLEDAFLLFETLNDRGLDLSAADLLKSHLLGKLSGEYGGDTQRVTNASNKWDEMLRTVPE